ncbi:MAG: FAD-dependent oxidoreductase [Chloroflexi bacterium]|nr:FAD-dependent oxidoreductase [Chloroflexota bacterium]
MNEPYDLVIIGAGSAGLTAVNFARQFGAKTALVERERIGGDCTWVGCVPSKALLHAAKMVQSARTAARMGLVTGVNGVSVDMARVRDYVQQTIASVCQYETPQIMAEQGVDVILEKARFRDAYNLEVGDRVIAGKKFLLATGAHPFVPPIPGLAETPFITYKHIFQVERLPQHLLVLGAGPIGVELAQAYGRLGAQVTLIDVGILPREDEEVGQVMEGVGRRANVEGMGLVEAGVAYGRDGIQVNDNLQTTAGHIYAAGDCLGGHQFTHFASWQAYKAVRNALLPGSSKGHSDIVPWTIFTDPEVAQVGLTLAEAQVQYGDQATVIRQNLDRVDRAMTDNALDGFIKMVRHRDGRILGATIVAPRAGEMISEVALAMQNNIKLAGMAHTIHPYPGYAIGMQALAADEVTNDFVNSRVGRIVRRLAG